jgi:hypothetical protein
MIPVSFSLSLSSGVPAAAARHWISLLKKPSLPEIWLLPAGDRISAGLFLLLHDLKLGDTLTHVFWIIRILKDSMAKPHPHDQQVPP